MRITIEKQRSWGRDDLENKLALGVEGFTITDLPFSSILAGKINTKFFLNLPKKFFSKLLQKTDDTFTELKYTPSVIVCVAANGRFKKTLRTRINKIVDEYQILGLFVVSGGGVLQRYFRNISPFNLFLTSSADLISYARNKYPNLKIFAAANPNLESENLQRLLKKGDINALITQPPFVWSRFEKYLQEISGDERTKNIEIKVGVPIFTSPWNVRFWMQLVSLDWKKEKEAEEIVRLFEQKYNEDATEKKTEFKKFSKNWTLNFIAKIQKLQEKYPQVSGIHLMPMGNYIPVEDIISAISATNLFPQSPRISRLRGPDFASPNFSPSLPTSVTPIKYDTIKYKNHFRILDDENFSDQNKVYLDTEFVEQGKSKIWELNQMFWENVDEFMSALGKSYHKSIGGSADSNSNLANYSAKKFFEKWKGRSASGEGINYLEMGAAGTEWAKMFLGEINNLGGLSNLNYIFTDYSQKTLDLAKKELGEKYQNANIKYIYLGNGGDKKLFQEYKNKINQIHATNIYDNFPVNRILYQSGKIYKILVRAFVLSEDKSVFENYWQNCTVWQKMWNELKFEEKYGEITEVADPELFKFYQKLNPANTKKSLELEMNVSPEVNLNILRNISLLKEGGTLEIIDIIATNLEKHLEFLGPVKYDGSVATYVNWPEIKLYLEEKLGQNNSDTTFFYHIDSLEKFGGRKNQSILEIRKISRQSL